MGRCTRPRRALCNGMLAAALVAPPALAQEQVVDFREFGTYTTGVMVLCATTILTDDHSALSLTASGLGVDGPLGSLADLLDGAESLQIGFAPPGATRISYEVGVANDQNGNGRFGDAFVEAFQLDSEGEVSLGVQPVSGVGPQDVSALFSDVPIAFIRITASGDGQRIRGLRFTPEPASPFALGFEGLGTFSAGSYERCGVTVTGSNDVSFSPLGLGVVDGAYPSALNGAEWLEFAFESPRTEIHYANDEIAELNGNALAAQAFLQAFDAQGASLGAVAMSGQDFFDVSVLFGDVPISAFRVTANADAQTIALLIFSPEPGAMGATAGVVLGLGALARARRSAGRVV